ncbi:MAG TPA: (Fe-S)-binding protein, partial [Pirellulales bacterium]
MKVALMITCLGDTIRPSVGQATVRLLRRLGCQVVFPQLQTCCGQPHYNSGFEDLAREQAKYTLDVFREEIPVVVPSGSCAAMVKVEYPHLLQNDAALHVRANQLAARTFELSAFLVHQLGVLDVGAKFAGKVSYHFACHLRALGQEAEAVELIKNVAGATYVPAKLADQCCGFGGSFSVRYPQISGPMVKQKVEFLAATEADLVATTDAGCLMNIAGRARR